jgi:hypothetical protein
MKVLASQGFTKLTSVVKGLPVKRNKSVFCIISFMIAIGDVFEESRINTRPSAVGKLDSYKLSCSNNGSLSIRLAILVNQG